MARPTTRELDMLFAQADAGFLLETAPGEIWPELARGLMGRAPSRMLGISRVRRPGTGVARGRGPVRRADALGRTEPRSILAIMSSSRSTRRPAPAPASRFVSRCWRCMSARRICPREHLPVHYKHIERALPRIEAIAARFQAPGECRELALLALAECERVHRVSKMRAGPVALMLERLGAFDAPGQFARISRFAPAIIALFPGARASPIPRRRCSRSLWTPARASPPALPTNCRRPAPWRLRGRSIRSDGTTRKSEVRLPLARRRPFRRAPVAPAASSPCAIPRSAAAPRRRTARTARRGRSRRSCR